MKITISLVTLVALSYGATAIPVATQDNVDGEGVSVLELTAVTPVAVVQDESAPTPVESEPVIQEPAAPAPVESEPAIQEPAEPEPAIQEPAAPAPVEAEPVIQEPAAPAPAAPAPVASKPAIQESSILSDGMFIQDPMSGCCCQTCCVDPCCCPAPPARTVFCLVDPCGCSHEACVNVPACCAGEQPCITWRSRLFGRQVATLCWRCCGREVKVVITRHGRVKVRG